MSDDKKQKSNWGLVLVGVILVSVITVANSEQTIKWADWTGFSGKTLWDLLELSSRLLVPILLFIFGLWFQNRDKKKEKEEQDRLERERQEQTELERKRAEQQAELEREIAKDNRAEEAIQAYLDNMAKLLIDEELRKELFLNVNDKLNPGCDNPVINVVITQTITILRRLEGDIERQNRIIYFLRDAKLDEFILKNANLSRIQWPKAAL